MIKFVIVLKYSFVTCFISIEQANELFAKFFTGNLEDMISVVENGQIATVVKSSEITAMYIASGETPQERVAKVLEKQINSGEDWKE